jgi:hypothetical protein
MRQRQALEETKMAKLAQMLARPVLAVLRRACAAAAR